MTETPALTPTIAPSTLPVGVWWVHVGGTFVSSYLTDHVRGSAAVRRNGTSVLTAAGWRASTTNVSAGLGNGRLLRITDPENQKIDVSLSGTDPGGTARQMTLDARLSIRRAFLP